MVKILGISSSPRKAGTDYAVKKALEGAADIGEVETKYISLRGKTIHPCIHCEKCMRTNTCVYDDDAQEIIQAMFEADGIIIGSPVYDMNYNAQLACLFNRFRSRSHDLHQDIRPFGSKVGGAIAVGGSRNGGQEITVSGILNFFLSQGMVVMGGEKWENAGSYVFSNDHKRWDENRDPEAIRSAFNLGNRIACLSRIIHENPTDIILK
ncbi:flavodoxin family protein [Clostridia bacterium]|nr:flavodoxin family protein [Clostridia bacterium]